MLAKLCNAIVIIVIRQTIHITLHSIPEIPGGDDYKVVCFAAIFGVPGNDGSAGIEPHKVKHNEAVTRLIILRPLRLCC